MELDICWLIFGIWQGRQSIRNGFGIGFDGFSARKVEYGSILKVFYDFGLLGSSPAGPTWVLTQVDLGSARPKPKLTWVLPGQNPSGPAKTQVTWVWAGQNPSQLGFYPGRSQVNLGKNPSRPCRTGPQKSKIIKILQNGTISDFSGWESVQINPKSISNRLPTLPYPKNQSTYI